MERTKTAFFVLLFLGAAWQTSAGSEGMVTLDTLLDAMIDRDTLARFPDPSYTCMQFSSYDRASKTPEDHDGWFANRDHGQHLRVEETEGRKEWVMMDVDGPGAVVRFWSANPKGTLRVYLDGGPDPVIEAPMAEALTGKWKVPPPLSADRSRGCNLYLPIPYAEHCKITSDDENFYYQINYRTYEKGTEVETLTAEALEEAAEKIIEVGEILLLEKAAPPKANPKGAPPELNLDFTLSVFKEEEVASGEVLYLPFPSKPMVIRRLELLMDTKGKEITRSLLLDAVFDGVQTIWCPVTDFFGLGVGADEVKDFYRRVEPGKPWVSLWSMPYEKNAMIRFLNQSEDPVHVKISCVVDDWTWDDRSMHFFARWRFEHPIPTRPKQDWNYVEITGKGVFVGDTLAVINPVSNWWGEGDEKIYFDGQTFPSHFGTGTEDYYGYAWCCNEPFHAPFHGQPRCDGLPHGNNWGHSTVTRVRALDAIPFEEDFKFDMEVWHWKECEVGYGATTFFYARPGARHNRFPQPLEALMPVPEPPPLPPPFSIEGAIECEDMKILDKSEGIPAAPQNMRGFGREVSSNERHLWVQGRRKGDFVELEIPVEKPGRYKFLLYATRSWDYGIIRFFVNGGQAGEDVDLFNQKERKVEATGALDLGVFEPRDGRMILRAEVVGGHERSEGSKSFFGLDCVVLEKAD